jgi:peptidoglycan-N-acetylglucosamine deacetylase
VLYDHDLNGEDLPFQTLCLTYDDGPGTHTEDLGRFLFEERIPAAFFVIGRLAAQTPGLLHQLRDWGHVIGNHTWNHPGLVTLMQAGEDPIDEILRTDAVIRPYAGGPIFLRPPYGSWRARTRPDGPEDATTSIVAERLRASGRFTDYVGPIMWDILAEDWECWRCGLSVEECASRHLAAIEAAGRGIVLLHDSSEDDTLRPRNRTAEMTRLLVPELQSRGYRFVSLHEVPSIAAALEDRHCSKQRPFAVEQEITAVDWTYR